MPTFRGALPGARDRAVKSRLVGWLCAALAVAALEARGAKVEALPVAPRLAGVDVDSAVRDPDLVDRVEAARGVFFTGGAQERIVDTLQPGGHSTPLLEAIRGVLVRGGVVAGTSAGAVVLGELMFRDAPDVVAAMKGRLRDGQEVDRGLGLAAGVLLLDQHFLSRGRLGRMLPLMQARGLELGLGVEDNSAVVLRGASVEVVGDGGALLVDMGEVTSDPRLGAFNLSGVRLSYPGDGDRLDLATRAVTPAPVRARGQRIEPAAPGFEFRFLRGPDTTGWYTTALGVDSYTIANLRLDVTPVWVAQPLYGSWQP